MSILSFFGEVTTYYGDVQGVQSDDATNAAVAGIITAIVISSLVLSVLAYVVWSYFLGRVFKKAGVESWKAWVPVYSNWILLELGNQQGFWAVLALVPVVNIISSIFMYIAYHNIGLKLGKESVFVLMAIFLPLIWVIWLALDSSTWKNEPKSPTKSTA